MFLNLLCNYYNYYVNKKIKKLIEKKCYVCDEDNYCLLDVHRIDWGKKYSVANTVVLCTSCHRRLHSVPPTLIIHGWNMSTKGRVLHYENNGIEEFK
jgi:hypothetical protein